MILKRPPNNAGVLPVDDFEQMSTLVGQLKNWRRRKGIKEYGLLGKAQDAGAAMGDAYSKWTPEASDLVDAPVALLNMIAGDVAQKTHDVMATDPNDPEALRRASQDSFDLAGYAAGGGFGASRLMGPKGDAILGAHVWQGGPHKYGPEGARESLKHMSKGEGAQAYGWGRYDAGAKEVGEQYQKNLGGSYELIDKTGAKVDHPYADWVAKQVGEKERRGYGGALRDQAILQSRNMDDTEKYKSMMEAIKIHEDGGSVVQDSYLYKHDLPDEDIARYLDWDAPLSEQPESVRAAFGYGGGEVKAIDGGFSDGVNTVKITMSKDPVAAGKFQLDGIGPLAEKFGLNRIAAGEDQAKRVATEWLQGVSKKGEHAYGEFAGKLKRGTDMSIGDAKQAASEALAKAGIPGLKYYDGMSRTKHRTVNGEKLKKNSPEDKAAHMMELWGDRVGRIELELKGTESKAVQKKIMAKVNEYIETGAKFGTEQSGTHNYVTWDQDVLDRMKLLERNGINMLKVPE
jgi:hypothetical protein